MRAAIEAEAARLGAIEAPLDAVAAVGEVFNGLDDVLDELSVPRLRAIARLRAEGWSYERIAESTRLSKGRVAQLAREAKRRGL
ncbi:hypothetical protein GCM10028801_45440 [Nocardioides maradonensis]